jgi:hypothetical protein
MYTLFFYATCKTACISQAVDVLYILLLLGTPAIGNLVHTTQKKGSKIDYRQSTNRSLRHLSNEKQLNQYLQAMFSLRQMLIAYV